MTAFLNYINYSFTNSTLHCTHSLPVLNFAQQLFKLSHCATKGRVLVGVCFCAPLFALLDALTARVCAGVCVYGYTRVCVCVCECGSLVRVLLQAHCFVIND